MPYRREDFPKATKHLVLEFPELCDKAPKAEIAALKAAVAKHNKAIDAELRNKRREVRSVE